MDEDKPIARIHRGPDLGQPPATQEDADAAIDAAPDDYTCTVTEAIAWLAYGDEQLAVRYGAPLHVIRRPGWKRRGLDVLRPHAAKLPGTDAYASMPVGPERSAQEAIWAETDSARWRAAHDKLAQRVQDGTVRRWHYADDGLAPDPDGIRTLREMDAAGYRVNRNAMRRLVDQQKGTEPQRASPQKVAGEPELAQGSDSQVNRAIEQVYAWTERENMKPPNIKELPRFVAVILRESGLKKSDNRIATLARDDPDESNPHDRRRGKAGQTLAATRKRPLDFDGFKRFVAASKLSRPTES